MACLAAPRLEMHKGKVSIGGDNRRLAKSFVRHMNLVCMAFEKAVPDVVLQAAAKDSNHPWAVALRVAIDSTVCPACHGHGKVFVMAPDMIHGINFLHHPQPALVRHELGACRVCHGTGSAVSGKAGGALQRDVLEELIGLHHSCPPDGPSDRSTSHDWCKDNRWVRCTDLTRGTGNSAYNGLDFLSLEVLLRLAGEGGRL